MLFIKKIKPGTGKKKEEKPIDVAWLLFIGMNKFGYTEQEAYLLPMGKWIDMFETYKRVHNFDTQRMLYQIEDPAEKKGSIFDL